MFSRQPKWNAYVSTYICPSVRTYVLRRTRSFVGLVGQVGSFGGGRLCSIPISSTMSTSSFAFSVPRPQVDRQTLSNVQALPDTEGIQVQLLDGDSGVYPETQDGGVYPETQDTDQDFFYGSFWWEQGHGGCLRQNCFGANSPSNFLCPHHDESAFAGWPRRRDDPHLQRDRHGCSTTRRLVSNRQRNFSATDASSVSAASKLWRTGSATTSHGGSL